MCMCAVLYLCWVNENVVSSLHIIWDHMPYLFSCLIYILATPARSFARTNTLTTTAPFMITAVPWPPSSTAKHPQSASQKRFHANFLSHQITLSITRAAGPAYCYAGSHPAGRGTALLKRTDHPQLQKSLILWRLINGHSQNSAIIISRVYIWWWCINLNYVYHAIFLVW